MSSDVSSGKRYAVVRVRGTVRATSKLNTILRMLRLYRKNFCVILDGKDISRIKQVKDYVTYGEINKETEQELIKKRGEKTIGKDGKETLKPFFRLNPPRKGFGRKGIKVSFSQGGGLGYRAEKINDLVMRML
jgi:large subunit ribosomal protein L30